MSSEQKDNIPEKTNILNSSFEERSGEAKNPQPRRFLRLNLSQIEPTQQLSQEIQDAEGNVIGWRSRMVSITSFGYISGDVEDLTRELASRRGLENPSQISALRARLIELYEKQEVREAQKKKIQELKDAEIYARKQAKAAENGYLRYQANGRKFLYTRGVGIDLERLFEIAKE